MMSGKQTSAFLNNRDIYPVKKDILLSHCSDANVYANITNKVKLILEHPEDHNVFSCIIHRQTKHLNCSSSFLRFSVLFVGFFAFLIV